MIGIRVRTFSRPDAYSRYMHTNLEIGESCDMQIGRIHKCNIQCDMQIFTDQRKFRRNFRVTDIQQLFNHHSSYTTHQISWQVQQFVNLHVQISWQAQYKMRFREIADARNAVFFNRTGGFEPGKSSSADDCCETVSGHARSAVHCD